MCLASICPARDFSASHCLFDRLDQSVDFEVHSCWQEEGFPVLKMYFLASHAMILSVSLHVLLETVAQRHYSLIISYPVLCELLTSYVTHALHTQILSFCSLGLFPYWPMSESFVPFPSFKVSQYRGPRLGNKPEISLHSKSVHSILSVSAVNNSMIL